MRLGIFAKTFVRPTVEQTLDAVREHGLDCVQFNLTCAGLPSLPNALDRSLCERVRRAHEERQIAMAAVSGTFNMIHPDANQRREGLRRLRVLAAASRSLGASVITLCTGTRDPENMWRRHPDNDSPQAWKDLINSMKEALKIAEDNAVILAFEPEIANVVDSAAKARRLLHEMNSSRLTVVLDAANLFHVGELPRMHEILDEALTLLGNNISIAHAKDLSHDGEAGREAAGKGLLDYDYYVARLQAAGFDGPLILHGLNESQVDGCVAFLRGKLRTRKPLLFPQVRGGD